MKKLALLAIFGLLTLGSSAQKFGHIDSQELLSLMPEITTVETSLQAYMQVLQGQLISMENEYKSALEDYENNESSYDDLTKQDKELAIKQLIQRIQTFEQGAQPLVQEKQQELMRPIIEKVQNAINAVAEKGKYTYILDSSSSVILYKKDSEDILEKVKLELKI